MKLTLRARGSYFTSPRNTLVLPPWMAVSFFPAAVACARTRTRRNIGPREAEQDRLRLKSFALCEMTLFICCSLPYRFNHRLLAELSSGKSRTGDTERFRCAFNEIRHVRRIPFLMDSSFDSLRTVTLTCFSNCPGSLDSFLQLLLRF